MLAALAFIPVNGVVDTFDTLLEGYAPASTAQPIIDYFEDNFKRRLTRRYMRRTVILVGCMECVGSVGSRTCYLEQTTGSKAGIVHFIRLSRVLIRHCKTTDEKRRSFATLQHHANNEWCVSCRAKEIPLLRRPYPKSCSKIRYYEHNGIYSRHSSQPNGLTGLYCIICF